MFRTPQPLACLLLAALTSAQSTIESLSFGHQGVISPSGHGIPGWHASSVNHDVQVLSDRIILSPPYPGSAKGALWSEATTTSPGWTAQVDFRASGQEMGSGNLNIWYTKDKDAVGVNSVYNVDKFDGLVLVVDQYGGTGGKIRGFLNDGSHNFRTQGSLESLAFGHCDYAYRNRGAYSQLRVSNTNGLSVTIDGQTCFSTEKASMPSGYFFGITASTAENPDSFEINKFVVTSGDGSPVTNQANVGQMHTPQLQKLDAFPGSVEFTGDRAADEIKTESDQFEDLHNRVQNLQHNMANMFLEIKTISDKLDSKHSEMLQNIQNVRGSQETGLPPEIVGKINQMSDKIAGMERTLEAVKKDTEGRDYKQHLQDLHLAMEKIHGGVTEGLPDRILDIMARHSPRLGFLVFVVVAVQLLLAGGYIVYKRRRNSMPKKYL